MKTSFFYETLTRLLLGKKVEVRKGQFFAYYPNKNLIRYVPLKNKELELALFIHELGHIKWSTPNFKMICIGPKKNQEEQKTLFLNLEDLRVDTLALEDLKGFKLYYEQIAENLYKYDEKKLSRKFDNILANMFRTFCGHPYKGKHKDSFLKVYPLFIKAIRAKSTERCFRVSTEIYPHLVSI